MGRTCLVALLAVGVALLGCEGTTSEYTIPKKLRRIHFTTLENHTNEVGIEELVTFRVREAFLNHAQIALVGVADADAVVTGRVSQYVRQPIAFDQNNVATLYRCFIVVQAEMHNPETGESFWQEEYVDHETTYSSVVPPVETESVAKERLARFVATDMLTRVTEGWINLKK